MWTWRAGRRGPRPQILPAALLALAAVPTMPALADSVSATIDGQSGKYQFLEQASQRWRLCAVLPHAFDRFFWAVAYGLSEQARAVGVDIGISEAGGYEKLAEQKRLIRQCAADHADAVLIAAINPTALQDELALLVNSGIKVIDLVNGLEGAAVTAHSHQDFSESGALAAKYVLKTFRGQALRVAWFPGPADARWATAFDASVRKTLAAGKGELKSLTLVDGGWGAPYISTQSGLVRKVARSGPVDVILANALAAEFSARFFQSGAHPPSIVSLYATDGVVAEMKKGRIAAMVANAPVSEARVAVDLAVRALERQRVPKMVHIPLRLVTQDEIASYSASEALAPANLRMPLPKLPTLPLSPAAPPPAR